MEEAAVSIQDLKTDYNVRVCMGSNGRVLVEVGNGQRLGAAKLDVCCGLAWREH